MSDPSGAASCCAVTRYHLVIGVLLLLLGFTSTGWVMTATREQPTAAAQPAPEPVPLPPVAQAPVETVEVLVAAKDLPVGFYFSREELEQTVKVKKLPKDALPPAYVANTEDLIDKRLTRPVRMEETFNPHEVSKGSPQLTLPEGYDLVSLTMGVGQTVGFVVPGSRVDIIATVRRGKKLHAFPLLVNVIVLAVDTHLPYSEKDPFPMLHVVSFGVREKEALALSLARQRGCTLDLLLRHPTEHTDAQRDHNIDEVIKFLADEKEWPAPEVAPAPRPVGESR